MFKPTQTVPELVPMSEHPAVRKAEEHRLAVSRRLREVEAALERAIAQPPPLDRERLIAGEPIPATPGRGDLERARRELRVALQEAESAVGAAQGRALREAEKALAPGLAELRKRAGRCVQELDQVRAEAIPYLQAAARAEIQNGGAAGELVRGLAGVVSKARGKWFTPEPD